MNIGDRFGKLTAVLPQSDVYWIFSCDCGRLKSMPVSSVTSGHTKNCGCSHREIVDGMMKGPKPITGD